MYNVLLGLAVILSIGVFIACISALYVMLKLTLCKKRNIFLLNIKRTIALLLLPIMLSILYVIFLPDNLRSYSFIVIGVVLLVLMVFDILIGLVKRCNF